MARIGECLDLYGGRQGIWRREAVGDFPGVLQVEFFEEEGSVTFIDDEAEWQTGIAWSDEGVVAVSNDPSLKSHYCVDGQLIGVNVGVASLARLVAEQMTDPYLVGSEDWWRLTEIERVGDELKLILFFGDDRYPPYWSLMRTKKYQNSGVVLEFRPIDPILMNPSGRVHEPLFVQSLGGLDLKFRIQIDENEVRFGVEHGEGGIDDSDLVVQRSVDFTNLQNRVQFDREARWEDLNAALGRVSSALKLLP